MFQWKLVFFWEGYYGWVREFEDEDGNRLIVELDDYPHMLNPGGYSAYYREG